MSGEKLLAQIQDQAKQAYAHIPDVSCITTGSKEALIQNKGDKM